LFTVIASPGRFQTTIIAPLQPPDGVLVTLNRTIRNPATELIRRPACLFHRASLSRFTRTIKISRFVRPPALICIKDVAPMP
jgi:hypothetical protein